MSVIFNLDGTEIRTPEVVNQQEELAEDVKQHVSHLRSGFDELRTYRDDELIKSDWTQIPDGPLDSTTKAAWATYREKLRDLTDEAKAPYWFTEADWPLAPGSSEINPEALMFIKNNDDPLGIATTSWVGLTTNMVQKGNLPGVETAGIGTDIIGIGATAGLQVGDHLRNDAEFPPEGSLIGIVSGITTTSVSLASTSPVDILANINYFRSDKWYYQQDRPTLTYAVSAGSTSVVAGAGISFTITLTNQAGSEFLNWETKEVLVSKGSLEILPVATIGIATVNITVPSVTQPDSLTFFIGDGGPGFTTTVGVTTA